MRSGGAVAQLFPGRRLARGTIGLAAGVVEEGLLGVSVAFGLQPLTKDALETLQDGISRPYPEAAMLALRRLVMRAPFQALEHFRAVMFLDDAAVDDAGEVGALRTVRIGRRQHVLPFENLHFLALRTGNVRLL